MIELTGRRNRSSSANEYSYQVHCCGEYVSLYMDGRKRSSFLAVARDKAERCVSAEGPENVSIHAFDRHDLFSHVVELDETRRKA